jgi:hypothetical protein
MAVHLHAEKRKAQGDEDREFLMKSMVGMFSPLRSSAVIGDWISL